jgi:hypothetical protein
MEGFMTCECDNCDWSGDEDDLDELTDAYESVEAGCEYPAGRCPKCNACAYDANGITWKRDQLLEACVKALKDIPDHQQSGTWADVRQLLERAIYVGS